MENTTNEKRLETMRANLAKLENAADIILSKGDDMTSADRIDLLKLVNVAFHESGKIQGAASIDGTSDCAFCEKMRNAAKHDARIVCGYCYAYADKWKEAAWRRHQLNARILSSVLFTVDELATLDFPKTCIVRINEDGDIVNETHARNIFRIINYNNGRRFGFWYKNAVAVAKGLKAEGYTTREQLPANVSFVKSSILIGTPAEPDWFTDKVFTVYPDKETTENAIARGAWECNGRKCAECGWNCYKSAHTAPVQYISEYLRTSAAKRAEIVLKIKAEEA